MKNGQFTLTRGKDHRVEIVRTTSPANVPPTGAGEPLARRANEFPRNKLLDSLDDKSQETVKKLSSSSDEDVDRTVAETILAHTQDDLALGLFRPNGKSIPWDRASGLPTQKFHLKYIDLRHGYADSIDDLIVRVKDLKHLTGLNLESRAVTSKGLAHLPTLKLSHLDLGKTGVTDTEMEYVKGITTLQDLSLDGTKVTDRGIEKLVGLPQLRGIRLGGTNVTDDAVASIAKIETLVNVVLADTDVTDACMANLAKMPNLRSLDLSDTGITVNALKTLAGTRIDSLNVGNTGIGDAGVGNLQGMESLVTLNLGGTRVTEAGLAHLATLVNLRILAIVITDAGLPPIANLVHVEVLAIRGEITDQGIQQLKLLKKLNSLDLVYTRVTTSGASELQKEIPQCRIVFRGGTLEPKSL